jgi:BolA family transcriptional regulator, general stress-responsive regulator
MAEPSANVATRIKEKLHAALQPVHMELYDESDRHIGHAGHDGRGESHFNLHIIAEVFEGKSRVDRQRLIHAAIAEELAERVHALSIIARAPSEVASG